MTRDLKLHITVQAQKSSSAQLSLPDFGCQPEHHVMGTISFWNSKYLLSNYSLLKQLHEIWLRPSGVYLISLMIWEPRQSKTQMKDAVLIGISKFFKGTESKPIQLFM